jgi:hypothetical protein
MSESGESGGVTNEPAESGGTTNEPAAVTDDVFATLTGGLAPKDEFTRSWVAQVILRLRRELSWQWRNAGTADRIADLLERSSLAARRTQFFAEDPAGHYLHTQLQAAAMPLRGRGGARGSLAWLARELELSRAEIFVVALTFAAARDAAIGHLIGRLQADSRQQSPTLGLAQWLWEEPDALMVLMSPAHPLFACGILRRADASNEWHTPLGMPPLVARILEGRLSHRPPELECIAERASKPSRGGATPERHADLGLELLAGRMAAAPPGLRVVPVAVAFAEESLAANRAAPTLRKLAALTGRPIYAIRPSVPMTSSTLENAAVYCWLEGADLLLPSQGLAPEAAWQQMLRPYRIHVFAAARADGAAAAEELPTLKIAPLSFAERRAVWHSELGARGLSVDAEAVRECAFRFRLDAAAIADVAGGLQSLSGPPTVERMLAACQQHVGQLIGAQAAPVTPRFRRDELILDDERTLQFDQLVVAMESLSRVHADWGTGRVWGDAGISALFSGAPGTGKTMAAEVLAAELHMPLYHVDLSQVVNKYIGETEKNLRKLFDAAEQADVVLFFDEADSLFGSRMQARSANDRFANMDVSYLLERMDRFRGLAILATNRRKDLDEAFLRRLRYVIEFPMPAEAERLAIWQKAIPPQVAIPGIDLALLAREFSLSGGNIRSIVWNACLQSAAVAHEPVLTLHTLMYAVDREFDKIGRPLTREQKARWQLTGPAAPPIKVASPNAAAPPITAGSPVAAVR